MSLIIQHECPAEYAPIISFNHCGRMPWSGRHTSDFTALELIELFKFCEEEGHRQGHLDANQGRIGCREQAPFHQLFMGGYPKQLWEHAYWIGVDQNGDRTLEAVELEIQKVLTEPDTSQWLRGALSSAVPRDCVDALGDAEHLTELLRRRYNAVALDKVFIEDDE